MRHKAHLKYLDEIEVYMRKVFNIAAMAGIVLATAASAARSQIMPRIAEPRIADVSHAEPATAKLFNGFFAAQSAKDVDGTMKYFSPDLLTYADAALGMEHPSFASLKKVFAEYMPKWGAGLCYPVRIIGGPDSALVAFTTTPEVWGAELRVLGAVDLKAGKIVRWVDYFDSTAYPAPEFAKMKTPQANPASFREDAVVGNASPKIRDVAARFQKALARGDAQSLGKMLSYDAVYEDMALRCQILGRASIAAYVSRVSALAPFGAGATLRHVVGGDKGGGFEWIGGKGMENVLGITALELDSEGQVSRVTTTYDAR